MVRELVDVNRASMVGQRVDVARRATRPNTCVLQTDFCGRGNHLVETSGKLMMKSHIALAQSVAGLTHRHQSQEERREERP